MKFFYCLLISIFLSFNVQAQLFDEIKKEENINDSKFVITIFTGYGFGNFSYDANKTDLKYNIAEGKQFVGLSNIPIGGSFLLKKEFNGTPIYFGAGARGRFLSGKTYTKPEEDIKIVLAQPFGRLEVPFARAKKAGGALFIEGGPLIAVNTIGEDVSGAFFGSIGYNFSLKLSANSNLLLELLAEYDRYNNIINNHESNNNIVIFELGVGLRFGA